MTPLKSKVLHRNGLADEVIRVDPWILVLSRFLFCFGSWHFLVISCFCLTSMVEVYSISSKSFYFSQDQIQFVYPIDFHVCSWYRVEPIFLHVDWWPWCTGSSFTSPWRHDGSGGAAGRAPGPWTPQRGATEGRSFTMWRNPPKLGRSHKQWDFRQYHENEI